MVWLDCCRFCVAVFGYPLASWALLSVSESNQPHGQRPEQFSVGEANKDLDGKIHVCVEGLDRKALENAYRADPLNKDEDLFTTMSTVMKKIEGARVVCREQDNTIHELMGTATTNEDGCATVAYDTSKGWDWWGKPDIVCTVSHPEYERKETNQLWNVDGSEHTMDKTTLVIEACGSGVVDTWLFNKALPESFQPACVLHDLCYDTCGLAQEECDSAQFQRAKKYNILMARLVHEVLKKEGGDAYDAAQDKACTKTHSPTTCPEATWSIKGGSSGLGSDLACWEEKLKICDNYPADARTKMEGHWLKAAKQLDWSYEWTQGEKWQGGVAKKGCVDRDFTASEEVQCFDAPLNNGCMYD